MAAFKGRHLADLMEAFAMAGLPYDGLFMAASRRARQMADAGGGEGRGGGLHAWGEGLLMLSWRIAL